MAKLKLNKQIIEELADYHSRGIPIKHAVALVGISKSSYYSWMKKGEQAWESLEDENSIEESEERIYIELYRTMKKARALAVEHYINKIWESPSATTIIFMLRHLAPEDFNVPFRSEQTTKSYMRLDKMFSDKKIKELANKEE